MGLFPIPSLGNKFCKQKNEGCKLAIVLGPEWLPKFLPS